ncbi:pheromone processing endoprotease [Phlyctochytrium planicorne]|nr:pheromone processing endoprotease [Phlyctochytrium planicorne]
MQRHHEQPDHNQYLYFAIQVSKHDRQEDEHPDQKHYLHRRAENVATEFDLDFVGPVGELHDYFQVAIKKPSTGENDGSSESKEQYENLIKDAIREKLENHPHVVWAEQQVPKRRLFKRQAPVDPAEDTVKRPTIPSRNASMDSVAASLGIADPLFTKQWHLFNREPSEKGNDINVAGVWAQGIYGEGVNVCFVDDGLDYEHDDLKENFVGVRILSGSLTEADEAAAINYNMKENHIYSCSWGPPDDGRSMDAPPRIVKDAVTNGIVNGRSGLGSVFVFAAGNGGASHDNCNFDGYTNSIYTITVAAVDRKNNHPAYSEQCAANMVCMYSSGSGSHIVTTDWGPGTCTESHGGTSAAAPLLSGILALVLSIRPELTWRDVQHLTLRTAIPINTADGSWEKTAAGRIFSHKFGYGKVDSVAIVETAKDWKLVNPQVNYTTEVAIVEKPIPQGEGAATAFFLIEQKQVEHFLRLEHITVTVHINHTRRGDVNVKLISPLNVVSNLAVARPNDHDVNGFRNWTFMTVKHWEEPLIGEWKVLVHDDENPKEVGVFNYCWITFFGEAKPANQPTIPEPPTKIENPTPPVVAEPDTIASPTPLPIDPSGSPSAPAIDQWIFLIVIAAVTMFCAAIYLARRSGLFSRAAWDKFMQVTGLWKFVGYKFQEINPDENDDEKDNVPLKDMA